MATEQLPVSGNSQSETNTQSPQSNAQSINSGTKTSSVQPGTTTSLLNGQGSVTLHPTALTNVSLTNTQPATAPVAAATTAKHRHHVNPVLFGFSALLFLIAVVLIWTINRSAKKTG
jgi:hypothetical protein